MKYVNDDHIKAAFDFLFTGDMGYVSIFVLVVVYPFAVHFIAELLTKNKKHDKR